MPRAKQAKVEGKKPDGITKPRAKKAKAARPSMFKDICNGLYSGTLKKDIKRVAPMTEQSCNTPEPTTQDNDVGDAESTIISPGATKIMEPAVNHLAKLPRELRDMIWKEVLYTGGVRTVARSPKEPAVARICKAFREEVLPVFYKDTLFVLELNFMNFPDDFPHSVRMAQIAEAQAAWLGRLESSSWLQHVKSWAFAGDVWDIHSMIQSVCVLLTLEFGGITNIEVHKNLDCVLGSNATSCVVEPCLSSINDLFINCFGTGADYSPVKAKDISDLMKSLTRHESELFFGRCDAGNGHAHC